MSEVKERNHHTPEQKYKIVKVALTTDTPISVICRKYEISPGYFYKWRDLYFEGDLSWFDENGQLESSVQCQTVSSGVLPEGIQSVLVFWNEHQDVGYRKLTWMMIDADAAYMSVSNVYHILSVHKVLYGWNSVDNTNIQKVYKHKLQYVHHH